MFTYWKLLLEDPHYRKDRRFGEKVGENFQAHTKHQKSSKKKISSFLPTQAHLAPKALWSSSCEFVGQLFKH